MAEYSAGQPYQVSTLRFWETRLRLHGAAPMRRRMRVDADGMADVPKVEAPRMARVTVTRECDSVVVVEIADARVTVRRDFDTELFRDVVRTLRAIR